MYCEPTICYCTVVVAAAAVLYRERSSSLYNIFDVVQNSFAKCFLMNFRFVLPSRKRMLKHESVEDIIYEMKISCAFLRTLEPDKS